MGFHILKHLLDERAHAFYLFVLRRIEVRFVLVVHAVCVVFLGHRLHTGICSQKLFLFRLILFYIHIFAETKFVKFRCSIVWLKVFINIYE